MFKIATHSWGKLYKNYCKKEHRLCKEQVTQRNTKLLPLISKPRAMNNDFY